MDLSLLLEIMTAPLFGPLPITKDGSGDKETFESPRSRNVHELPLLRLDSSSKCSPRERQRQRRSICKMKTTTDEHEKKSRGLQAAALFFGIGEKI
jgi:hypothetical protein